MMKDLAVRAIDHHQSRLVAALRRSLRDEVSRKVIVEKFG
jgi:hypothetical protein